jgi:hypothetical protein
MILVELTRLLVCQATQFFRHRRIVQWAIKLRHAAAIENLEINPTKVGTKM